MENHLCSKSKNKKARKSKKLRIGRRIGRREVGEIEPIRFSSLDSIPKGDSPSGLEELETHLAEDQQHGVQQTDDTNEGNMQMVIASDMAMNQRRDTLLQRSVRLMEIRREKELAVGKIAAMASIRKEGMTLQRQGLEQLY